MAEKGRFSINWPLFRLFRHGFRALRTSSYLNASVQTVRKKLGEKELSPPTSLEWGNNKLVFQRFFLNHQSIGKEEIELTEGACLQNCIFFFFIQY